MSAPEPTAKRQRADGEQAELVHGLVIVSNVGDTRPEEIVPDTMAAFCLNISMSVRSYVVVPDFALYPIFLAKYKREADPETGKVEKRYVKRMIPRTRYLQNITCDVMMLCCHGTRKFEDVDGVHHPHSLCFNEPNSVDRHGDRHLHAPLNSQIWSCSSYKDDEHTYTKREDSITLSEVVCRSKLVLLLCCCGGPIMQEYRAEMGEIYRPDFVYFAMDHIVHDTSINIFLALLIAAMDTATDSSGAWPVFFKRCVCQVLQWIQFNGTKANADTFWTFLKKNGYIEMRAETALVFRIKGCINNFGMQPDDKKTMLQELQSVTLLMWDGTDREINHETDQDHLDASIRATPFTQESPGARAQSPISLDALLLQLRGLMRDA